MSPKHYSESFLGTTITVHDLTICQGLLSMTAIPPSIFQVSIKRLDTLRGRNPLVDERRSVNQNSRN